MVMRKIRNPVAKEMLEDRAFRLKVFSDKRKQPKTITVQEATKIVEEEEDND